MVLITFTGWYHKTVVSCIIYISQFISCWLQWFTLPILVCWIFFGGGTLGKTGGTASSFKCLFPATIRSKELGLYFCQERKARQTLRILMVFFIVFLFTQSDEKTFFTMILKLTNIHVPLDNYKHCFGKMLGKNSWEKMVKVTFGHDWICHVVNHQCKLQFVLLPLQWFLKKKLRKMTFWLCGR